MFSELDRIINKLSAHALFVCYSARMPELLQKLNIPQNSNLAVMMSRTMAQCEAHETMTTTLAAKDSHKCMTSLEDMTNFVAARLPRDATISTLDRTISASGDHTNRTRTHST